ncbi:MAG TPA: hypothetical protein VIV57_18155 [Anaeromyxobacter sp.]
MRIETIPGAAAARFVDEAGGAIEVVWNGFRPPASLEGLSGEARTAVHRANLARRKLDLADYERFLDRHVEEARRLRTVDEDIAHGRPKIPEGPWEPGATMSERQDLASVNQGFVHDTTKAILDLVEIRSKLEARRMPLDVGLEASVGLKVRVGDRMVGAEASLTDGSVAGSYGAGGVVGKCWLDEAGKTGCAAIAGGAKVSSGGIESLEISTGLGYARASRESVAAGVKVGRTIGGDAFSVRAEAKVGLNVQLLDAETVRRALSNEDFWTKKR